MKYHMPDHYEIMIKQGNVEEIEKAAGTVAAITFLAALLAVTLASCSSDDDKKSELAQRNAENIEDIMAELEWFNENGVEEYEIISSGNANICARCAEMVGQVFRVDELVIGENAPPFHPNCGCVITGVAREEVFEGEPRGSYQDYLDAIGFRESSNRYDIVNPFGFMGRYQIGKPALQDIGWMDSNGRCTATAAEHGIAMR